MPLLTEDEVKFCQSLNQSELSLFLSQFQTEQLLDQVLSEILENNQQADLTPLNLANDYASERSRKAAEAINAKTAASQEIGPLPVVANPQRRERCEKDCELFAMTYMRATFYLPLAPYQSGMFDRFQGVIESGGKECQAVRRGGLKSTIARAAIAWATLNGLRRFPVLVGATDTSSNKHREHLFKMLESSTALIEDYPELMPLMLKWKQPRREFRLDGRLLEVSAQNKYGCIVFPDIHSAKSCQVQVAPFSINSTGVSGLAYVDRFGVAIRPDLIVFDDVQTPQSSKSPTMTNDLEESVTKTFCGLAGVGETLAAIMVCTVREKDDLSERFLSREKHPDWNGTRSPSLIKLPDRTDLWDKFGLLLTQGASPKEGRRFAHEFYLANEEQMKLGGVVAWEHDHQPDEASALESLMTIRAVDPSFFNCEIQQQGAAQVNASGLALDQRELMKRLSRVERKIVPEKTSFVTAFIDSSDEILWAMVCAWRTDFSGSIVDFRTWPDQGRPLFYKGNLAHTITQTMPNASWEEAFTNAHNQLEAELFADFPELDLLLKDWGNGLQKQRIEPQVMASANRSRIRPSKGFAPKPGRKPVHLWGEEPDRHTGQHWVERRGEQPVHVQFDTNYWKSHAVRRLMATVGAPSAVLLPGSDEQDRRNSLLVEHLTSERAIQISHDGTDGVAFEAIVGRDNDGFDCFVGNCLAASMLGCQLPGETAKQSQEELEVFRIPGRR